MREILGYLTHHLRRHAHPGLHLLLAALLAAAFVYNYGTDFKRGVMNAHPGAWYEPLMYLAFYGLFWYGALLLQSVLTRTPLPRSPAFWATSVFALALLTLNRTTVVFTPRLVQGVELDRHAAWYLTVCSVNLTRSLAFILPLLAFRLLRDRDQDDLYGFTIRRFTWRPYVLMLLLMAGPIVWASYQDAFLQTYPIYRPGPVERALGWPTALTYGVHELCYALRFVGVELFFRGFLVLGFVRWLGRGALLPMVCLYAVWHFGKPMPEALGSVFGGYILGVIAYESRCVLGGTLVHMGIALMMNLAALVRLLAR